MSDQTKQRMPWAVFIQGVFSEGDGSPSLSRVATGIVVGFACGWVTAIVRHTFTLPDFAGIALFIGTIYGINKASSALKKDPPAGQ